MIKTLRRLDNQKPRYDNFKTPFQNLVYQNRTQKCHRDNSNDTWLYNKLPWVKFLFKESARLINRERYRWLVSLICHETIFLLSNIWSFSLVLYTVMWNIIIERGPASYEPRTYTNRFCLVLHNSLRVLRTVDESEICIHLGQGNGRDFLAVFWPKLVKCGGEKFIEYTAQVTDNLCDERYRPFMEWTEWTKMNMSLKRLK